LTSPIVVCVTCYGFGNFFEVFGKHGQPRPVRRKCSRRLVRREEIEPAINKPSNDGPAAAKVIESDACYDALLQYQDRGPMLGTIFAISAMRFRGVQKNQGSMLHRGVAVLALVVAISPAHAGLIEYSFSVELDPSRSHSTSYGEFGLVPFCRSFVIGGFLFDDAAPRTFHSEALLGPSRSGRTDSR
jgi:hypothetical protein